MKLKAKKPLRYGGKRLAVDDTFETKGDLDAKILVATGQAEYDEPATVQKTRRSRPPKAKAEAPAQEAEEPATRITSTEVADALFGDRTYLRRDMTPEE